MTAREVLRASLRLLDRRDRRLLVLSMLFQISTAVLDLFGVILIGAVGALAVTIVDGQGPPRRVTAAASALGLPPLSPTSLIALLAGVAAALLLAKSVVSPLLMRRTLRFLAGCEAAVSTRLTRKLLARPLTFVQQRSTQETASALIQGASAATTAVLGQMVIAAAEIALILALTIVLVAVNPPVALGVVIFFGLLSVGQQQILGHRVAQCGAQRAKADIAGLRTVQEALGGYREITVADRRSFYVDRIAGLRSQAAGAAAEQQFLGILPRYVSEAALVLGGFALAAALFSTESVSAAAGTFALFLAAAVRMLPSLLRVQAAAIFIRGAAAMAGRTFSLAGDLEITAGVGEAHAVDRSFASGDSDFVPTIDLCDVGFSYPDAAVAAIRGITLSVAVGGCVALVGRSGSGKSTLADIILGVLDPDEGTVSVGGVPPGDAVRRWPGGIAYVPQDVMLAGDSVRNNVAIGLPRDLIDDDRVWDALRRAHLADYVSGHPDGLDAQIGERGLRLSGGQRQRLGIARALFTRPRLLVLDEATSSLDAQTEQAITEMLGELEHDVTKVIIAHRLSTVRDADLVVYLEGSRSVAAGTFDEVCAQVPALKRQAGLMGLRPA